MCVCVYIYLHTYTQTITHMCVNCGCFMIIIRLWIFYDYFLLCFLKEMYSIL